jgi:hypothetical protein
MISKESQWNPVVIKTSIPEEVTDQEKYIGEEKKQLHNIQRKFTHKIFF